MSPLRQFGEYCNLLYKGVRSATEVGMYRSNLTNELVKIGYESMPIIILTGIFSGAVMTIQTSYQLQSALIPKSTIGSIVSKSMIIELAAVVSSLVLAGKVGARISTELGTMRVSEQIDALESMGFNSVSFLVIPRIIGGIIMFPVLYLAAAAFGIGGGVLAGVVSGALPASEFMEGARTFFHPADVLFGLIKATVFGYIVTSIACYKGYYATGGAEGVGTSTTRATVLGCIYVLLADLILATILL